MSDRRATEKLFPLAKRFVTFSGGSVLGAAIDYALTMLCYHLLRMDPSVALALAMTVSASVVFLYHEKITFRASGPGRGSRYLRFAALAVLVLGLRVIAVRALTAAGLPVALALAIAIVLVSILNFAASSMLIFLRPSE